MKTQSVKFVSPSANRSISGFSLVTVTLMGLIATMWLTATMSSLIPAYRLASAHRVHGTARVAAEAAADWAVDSLNAAILDPSIYPSPLDPVSTPQTTTSVPAAVLNNPLATASVKVTIFSPPKGSLLFDQTYQNNVPSGYRMIESTATVGGFSKRIRTIIKQGFKPQNNNPTPNSNYALFGNTVVLKGNVQTDGYNSSQSYSLSKITATENPLVALGGDIGSLTSLEATEGTNTIGGSVDVTLQPAGSTQLAASGSNSTTVNRYLNLNGGEQGFADNTESTPNVLGYSNNNIGFPNELSTGRASSISIGQSASQPNLPPAPSAPTFFLDAQTTTPLQSLGTVTLGGESTTTVVVTSSAQPPPASGYAIVPGTTNYIRPGNYSASSLNIGTNGQIIVAPSSTQPFRIFVDGTTPGPNAVDITGTNGIRNFGAPSNVQIYYNGSKKINLQSMRGLSAVVYAPNASLNMTPNSNASYFGSFTGNAVVAKNASVHFDTALKDGSYLNALVNGSSYGPSMPKNQTRYKYSTVSWQEL